MSSGNPTEAGRLERLGRRSIRFRLAALYVTITGITLLLFSVYLHEYFSGRQQIEFDAALYNHTVDVAETIDVDMFGDVFMRRNPQLTTGKVFPFAIGRSFLQMRDLKGGIFARSETLGRTELPLSSEDLQTILQ